MIADNREKESEGKDEIQNHNWTIHPKIPLNFGADEKITNSIDIKITHIKPSYEMLFRKLYVS